MDAKIEKIVEALIKRNETDEVIWTLTSSNEGFQLQLSDSVLRVLRKNINGNIIYLLQIYNANGVMIVNQSVDGSVSPNRLKDLYESAKRVFYKKDATLDSILNQLNNNGKIGEDDSLPF